jgi:hypothetical protein
VEAIYKLIIELAIYEREPEAVKNTPEQLLKDGFGEHPLFHVYVVDRINKEGTCLACLSFDKTMCYLSIY